MSLLKRSVHAVKDLSLAEVDSIFSLARQIKNEPNSIIQNRTKKAVVATLFFEPSTRTRMSFHIACARLGIDYTDLGGEGASSLIKGETPEDTLYNVAAMKPDLMIVRHNGDPGISRAVQKLSVPVISGGGGTSEHPTQALLDAFTILELRGSLADQKILFVGDILHSRVAHSDIKLFKSMGAQVAAACPDQVYRADSLSKELKHFQSLTEGIKWATIVIGLRIQSERHKSLGTDDFSNYYLDQSAISHLRADGLLMHPGPFVPGQDMDRELLLDSRCAIHRQVEMGVYIRMALITKILEG